jgi:hypothetical protein
MVRAIPGKSAKARHHTHLQLDYSRELIETEQKVELAKWNIQIWV